MKKIISLVVALMMTATTVFANATDDFTKVWDNFSSLKSYTVKSTMSIEANEPIAMFDDMEEDYMGIDYPLLINDLLNSTVQTDISYRASEDFKKLEMAMSYAYDLPISINDDFKLEAWTRAGMWIDFDITNPDEPKLLIIEKSPLNIYYQVMDLSAEALEMGELLTPQLVEGMADSMLLCINTLGEVTESDGAYTIKLSNEAFFEYVSTMFKMMGIFVTDESEKGELDEAVELLEVCKTQAPIIGEDGLVLEFTTDNDGNIELYTESIHIDFNVFGFCEILGETTEGIAREKCNIDITLKAESELSGHNSTEVTFPELTEENSIVINEYEEYEDESSGAYESELSPLFLNNEVYFPLGDIDRNYENEFSYAFENDTLSITNFEGTTFPITKDTISTYGVVTELLKPQFEVRDGEVYVTAEVLMLLGYDPYTVYNKETQSFSFMVYFDPYVYNAFEVKEEEEEPTPVDPAIVEQYLNPYFYESVESDQVPYVDGEPFIPVYDLFETMFEGEFDITMQSLSYKATGVNRYGIDTISLYVGDNKVTIDDKVIEFEKPIVNVANIFRAPVEFVENMGFAVDDIMLSGTDTYFELTYTNPNYVE